MNDKATVVTVTVGPLSHDFHVDDWPDVIVTAWRNADEKLVKVQVYTMEASDER